MLKSFDLKRKKVIDVETAELVGYIRDMDIDFVSGKINSVTIPQKGILQFLKRQKTIMLPWENVLAIGREFVIIKQRESNITELAKR